MDDNKGKNFIIDIFYNVFEKVSRSTPSDGTESLRCRLVPLVRGGSAPERPIHCVVFTAVIDVNTLYIENTEKIPNHGIVVATKEQGL